ncbi:MAG TPA: SDR family NAD(P)-dependent oxidoreductase [Chloroflexota bacterium]|nr:SDR family NAD(P)-dependent oxidoreductase [Chloroflexota bacterium]
MKLRGRTAIVTGGGSGVGRDICSGLAGEGARLLVGDANPVAAEAVAARLRAMGAEAVALGVDVTDPTSVDCLVRRSVNRFGRVDILVNVLCSDHQGRSFDGEERRRSLASHLTGTLLCCAAVVPRMRECHAGSIVNVWLDRPIDPRAGASVWTRRLAGAFADDGIRINSVALEPDESSPGTRSGLVASARRPVRSAPRRDDPWGGVVAELLFLASDASRPLTAETLRVAAGDRRSHLAA